MDLNDELTGIRSKQLSENNPWIGVDAKELKVADMHKKNIIQPPAMKSRY